MNRTRVLFIVLIKQLQTMRKQNIRMALSCLTGRDILIIVSAGHSL